MSKSASSDCATRLTSAARRLTPRLILPDFTTMARWVTLLMTASSDDDRPVVPMIWTRPRSAAIATLAIVAPGTVKSRMPSALADSVHRSAESLTPFSGSPASTPESLPSSAEPGASSAPVTTAPGVSEMTRTSARPIRPPAPATIKRMSAMASPLHAYTGMRPFRQPIRPASGGLRAVIAFDDDEIALRMRAADRNQAGVFRRIVAGERGLVVLEFEHHVARPRRALSDLVRAAAHQELGAEFGEDRAVLRDVFLVAIHVVNIDACDPVAFRHLRCPFAVSPAPARFRLEWHPQQPWGRRLRGSAAPPQDSPLRRRSRAPAS